MSEVKGKLAVDEIAARFNMGINEGCLQDIVCPRCGWRQSFKIQIKRIVYMEDEGPGSGQERDDEIDGGGYCECGRTASLKAERCHHKGTVADFTCPGLDQWLRMREEGKRDYAAEWLEQHKGTVKEIEGHIGAVSSWCMYIGDDWENRVQLKEILGHIEDCREAERLLHRLLPMPEARALAKGFCVKLRARGDARFEIISELAKNYDRVDDFYDGNQIMIDAWTYVTGREPYVDSEHTEFFKRIDEARALAFRAGFREEVV